MSSTQRTSAIVVLSLDGQRYGLWLSAVSRVIRRVAVTPLPRAPSAVLGVVNVHGALLPVVDLRARFRLPERAPQLGDHMLLATTARRRLALIADAVEGVEPAPTDTWVDASAILARTDYLAGIAKRADGLILIHDLDTFLSLEEEQALDHALGQSELQA